MKHLSLVFFVLLPFMGLRAQDRRWEHTIYASAGLFIDHADYETDRGLSVRLGYGLNHYFSPRFSLMPGVAFRSSSVALFHLGEDGGDYDSFLFLDVPVMAQFHLSDGAGSWALGLGPVFSFCVQNDEYYIDADPTDPHNGQTKIKPFSLGLQPSLMYEYKWARFGIEANIGLLNVKATHGLTTGHKRLHDLMATFGVRF